MLEIHAFVLPIRVRTDEGRAPTVSRQRLEFCRKWCVIGVARKYVGFGGSGIRKYNPAPRYYSLQEEVKATIGRGSKADLLRMWRGYQM